MNLEEFEAFLSPAEELNRCSALSRGDIKSESRFLRETLAHLEMQQEKGLNFYIIDLYKFKEPDEDILSCSTFCHSVYLIFKNRGYKIEPIGKPTMQRYKISW